MCVGQFGRSAVMLAIMGASASLCAEERVPWKLVTFPGSSVKVVTNDVWAAEAVDIDTTKKTFALRGFYRGSGVMDLTKIKGDTGYSPVRLGMMTWIDTSQLKGETAISRTAVTEIIMADEIETTTTQVYQDAQNLGRIVCGSGLRELRDKAFSCFLDSGKNKNQTVLSNVVFSSGLEIIGEEAFCGCTNLTMVPTLSSLAALLKIGDKAFYKCPLEGAVVLSAPLIGANAFCGNHFTSLELADGVTNVGARAFRSSFQLEALSAFPASLETLGSACFDTYDDWQAKSWLGPTGVVDFSVCTKLRDLPNSAFFMNQRITEVRLPPGVTNIESQIFRGCTALTNVVATTATEKLYKFMQASDGHLGNAMLLGASEVARFDVPWGGRTTFDSDPAAFKTGQGLKAVYFFGKAPVPPGTDCPQFMTSAGESWSTRIYVSKKMDEAGWTAAVDHPDKKANWFGWFVHGESSAGTQRCPYAVWWKSPLDPVLGFEVILR